MTIQPRPHRGSVRALLATSFLVVSTMAETSDAAPRPFKLFVDGGATLPRWSPSGDHLAGTLAGDVHVWDRHGKQKAHFAEASAFAWSPDGGRIAVALGSDASRVITARPDGSDQKAVATLKAPPSTIAWAAPGTLVVSWFDEQGKGQLGRIAAAGGALTSLGAGEWVTAGPGERIAFIRDAGRAGSREVVVARADGGDAKAVATAPAAELQALMAGPRFSPDGGFIAWVGNDAANSAVSWLCVVDLHKPGTVARLHAVGEAPFDWSPDGKEIAVTDAPAANQTQPPLVAVKASGGVIRKLATGDTSRCKVWQPAWSKQGVVALHVCTAADESPGPAALRLYPSSGG